MSKQQFVCALVAPRKCVLMNASLWFLGLRIWFVWVLVTACLLWPSSARAQSCELGARVACPCGERGFLSGSRVCGPAGELGACICPSEVRRRVWYGQQTLLLDAAAAALAAGGLGLSSGSPSVGSVFVGLGGLVFGVGPPVVHWAHGHIGRGFVSMFAVRVAIPGGLGLLGYGIGAGASRGDPAVTAISSGLLSLLGVLVAVGIDGGILAFD